MGSSGQRILMVLESAYPAYGGGGAENQVRTLGMYLQQRGMQVTILGPMVAYGRQIARERIDGLEVIRLRYPQIRLLGGAILLARLTWFLFRNRERFDVFHAHIAHRMAAVSSVMGRWLGKPVVVKLTGMKEMAQGFLAPRRWGLERRIMRAAIGRACAIQATSQRIRSQLIASGFSQGVVQLIPNAVDIHRFRRSDESKQLRRDLCGTASLVGVYAGRLEPEKGVELLLRAWAGAFKGREDVRLVMVGDGRLREGLQALASELGVSDRVCFTGHTDDVSCYLGAADFGLLASYHEGLSNTLLEYMAAGLPVIGSRVSGTEDFVVDGETGWLFESGDRNQLEDRLRTMAALSISQSREMGGEARRRVAEFASVEAVGSKIIALYDNYRSTAFRDNSGTRA